eukprot:1162031-Pelagomonas_calceolata.AAC.1
MHNPHLVLSSLRYSSHMPTKLTWSSAASFTALASSWESAEKLEMCRSLDVCVCSGSEFENKTSQATGPPRVHHAQGCAFAQAVLQINTIAQENKVEHPRNQDKVNKALPPSLPPSQGTS